MYNEQYFLLFYYSLEDVLPNTALRPKPDRAPQMSRVGQTGLGGNSGVPGSDRSGSSSQDGTANCVPVTYMHRPAVSGESRIQYSAARENQGYIYWKIPPPRRGKISADVI
jgi:hypothetical protein